MNQGRTILIGILIVGAMVLAGIDKLPAEIVWTGSLALLGGAAIATTPTGGRSRNRIPVLLLVGSAAIAAAVGVPGCTQVQSPTQSDLNATELRATVNTGQNVQLWPDGAAQSTATAPESAQIAAGRIDYQGTSLSALMHLGPDGIGVRNPGNWRTDALTIDFGEPIALAEGERVIVPVSRVSVTGLDNEVTSVVEANTEQVREWVAVLEDLSEDQQAAIIAALERDRVITEATAGVIREALGIAGVLIP